MNLKNNSSVLSMKFGIRFGRRNFVCKAGVVSKLCQNVDEPPGVLVYMPSVVSGICYGLHSRARQRGLCYKIKITSQQCAPPPPTAHRNAGIPPTSWLDFRSVNVNHVKCDFVPKECTVEDATVTLLLQAKSGKENQNSAPHNSALKAWPPCGTFRCGFDTRMLQLAINVGCSAASGLHGASVGALACGGW